MAKHSVELVPFPVPETVMVRRATVARREDGFKPPVEIKLSELDEQTLNELVDEFRVNVFKKAGRSHD